MVVKAAEVWYTFPIVVIECEEGTTNPKLDAEGKISGKPMWYSIRETTYNDKWVKAFETMADSPTHPAGNWFVLNFTYTPKSGKHDKMGSARALQVGCKQMNDSYNQWAEYYNQLTEGWDEMKAAETVIANHYLELSDVQSVADTAMEPVRDKLQMFSLQEQGVGIAKSATSAESALAGFGATEAAPAAPAPATGSAPTSPAQLTQPQPVMGVDTQA
jgi:hypothetical protein